MEPKIWNSIGIFNFSSSDNDSIEMFTPVFYSNSEAKGVFVVIHGLNNSPYNMNSICSELGAMGYSVLRVSLSGHNKVHRPNEAISLENLKRDVEEAVFWAEQKAQELSLPLFVLGYSLGGLLTALLMKKERSLKISGVVLLAPALGLSPIAAALPCTRFLPKRIVLPSLNHKDYRYLRGANFSMYSSLSSGLKELIHAEQGFIHCPVFFSMDKRDGLVDYCKVRARLNLMSQSKVVEHLIDTSQGTRRSPCRHLILHQDFMGEIQFKVLMSSIHVFAASQSDEGILRGNL